ncbi:response regulator [Halovibrio sp. HP20-50]|uniref:response regulator n=1 Tax=Halovibrio sp. HP20-59 TaxID=3080275 RepID=UPI00294AC0C5|nr:response regulator [Halovibrio sp. HP20-59]MEA2120408.1 response regulator [Halovibrio sp. HP20-59]
MQRYRREYFWNAIVWPLLWPLLLVQAVLCLLVGVGVWWTSSGYTSLNTLLWLMAAMLLGSSLNVGTFLMLVKARARRKDSRFMQELTELERHSQALCATAENTLPTHKCASPEAVDETHRPLQRLASVNAVLAGLERGMNRSSAVGDSEQGHEQSLLDDLQYQQRQVKYLMAGRERAREESRLKSDYLMLLQHETDSLLDHLSAIADNDITADCRQNIIDVSAHLTDIRALLANLVQQSFEQDDGAESSSESENAGSQGYLRVLVVDDGPVNLMLARQMLESQGLQVEGVSSGEQALERQQRIRFDLVLMDIFMPTLDGLGTTRRWREYERTHGVSQSVLVAMTANADNTGRDACLAAGMDDLLIKPYQPETLLGIVAHWFPDRLQVAPQA